MNKKYQQRTYRNFVHTNRLQSFEVIVKETDLLVHARENLAGITRELVLEHRGVIETFIENCPEFLETLHPWPLQGPAPNIVKDMAEAGRQAGVGPMAAVAGTLAEYVGMDLLQHSSEVIVENGGDIFLKTDEPVTIGVFAAKSPLSLQIGLRVDSARGPQAVCTSSGTVGHSLSLGKADAVCVVSNSCALADAAATAIGNRVHKKKDIPDAIEVAKNIENIGGIAIVIGEDLGIWGELEMVPLKTKKG
jgi:ApbE superfamily uncharacterized protein (UPF0280 family)